MRDKQGKFMKGQEPYNKGLKMNKKQREIMEKKVYSKRKGKSYSEIYGNEKAKEIVKKQLNSFTPKRRLKISDRQKGKKHSDEHKKNISIGNMGKKVSHKTKEKISKKLMGHKVSKETIKKIKEKTKGKKHSEEQKKQKSIRMKEEYALRLRKKGMLGKKLSLEQRKRISERQRLDKHWNWLGGLSFEPYTKEFNKEFKRKIKIRDGRMCLKCSMMEEDHKKLWGLGLAVHHINYNKKLSTPENCCTLCNRCNTEANYNRKHWIKFYQSILSERYGYKYSLEEIKNGLDCVFKFGGVALADFRRKPRNICSYCFISYN